MCGQLYSTFERSFQPLHEKEISAERNERERSYKKYNKIDRTLSIVETMAECGLASIAGRIRTRRSRYRFRRYGDGNEIRSIQDYKTI